MKSAKKNEKLQVQYKPETLRKLQLAQCKILEDFIKICLENNLDYFIFAGCAIGVERHQGFIPWDDDIDIGMLRKDYNNFLNIAKREYSDKYSILEISEDDNFPFFNAEFKRKGTRNIPMIFKDANVDMGIDIAIYPFDNVADNLHQRRRQLISVFFWHKIKILREFGHPVLFIEGWKKHIVSTICVVMHYTLKLLHIPHKFINRMYMKSATKYNNTETKWVSCFFGTTPMENSMKRSEIFPLVTKKFEYLMVNVPRENNKCLTRKFGNYMEVPPIEKQKNHVPYILEFGDFDDIIIDK